MARGRKSKPIPIRKLQGNPGKQPMPDVAEAPDLDSLTPPPGLDYHGKQAWKRNAPILQAMGVLKQNHRDTLFAYCDAYAQLRRCQTICNMTFKQWIKSTKLDESEIGRMELFSTFTAVQRSANVDRKAARQDIRLYATEFGMTPASGAKLVLADSKQSDPVEDWMSGGRRSS